MIRMLMQPLEPRRCLPLDKVIAVGFGAAWVSCDSNTVWQEDSHAEWESLWTVRQAEDAAMKNPDADWRIHIVGALAEGHWQRQAANEWVMYEAGQGFA